MDDIFNKIINDVNYGCHIFLQIMKYIFSMILLVLGLVILISIKKKYWKDNRYYTEEIFRKYQIILGFFYLIIGFGILFNFFLYLLLWILPEGLISLLMKSFFQYYNLENDYLDLVLHILQQNIFPILSFMALMNLMLCFYYYANKNLNKNPRRITYWLLSSIATGLLVGFSTSIPYLL